MKARNRAGKINSKTLKGNRSKLESVRVHPVHRGEAFSIHRHFARSGNRCCTIENQCARAGQTGDHERDSHK